MAKGIASHISDLEIFSPFLMNYKMLHMFHSFDVMFLVDAFSNFINRMGGAGVEKYKTIEIQEVVPIAALFHDIGKTVVPNFILGENAQYYTLYDREFVDQHPELGSALLSSLFEIDSVKKTFFPSKYAQRKRSKIFKGIKEHHFYNTYDSSLKISEEAEIIALADILSAITQNRGYNSPLMEVLKNEIKDGVKSNSYKNKERRRIDKLIKQIRYNKNQSKDYVEDGIFNKELFKNFSDFLKCNKSIIYGNQRKSIKLKCNENKPIFVSIYRFDPAGEFCAGDELKNGKLRLAQLSFIGCDIEDKEGVIERDVKRQSLYGAHNKYRNCYVLMLYNNNNKELNDIPIRIIMYGRIVFSDSAENGFHHFHIVPSDISVWCLFVAQIFLKKMVGFDYNVKYKNGTIHL